jgi:predicted TIM-barrel enzyme
MADAAREVSPGVIVLCYGGPIATPDDAFGVPEHICVAGFFGASSKERLLTEVAMTKNMRRFKAIGGWLFMGAVDPRKLPTQTFDTESG